MNKLFSLVAIAAAALMVSCAAKPEKTIENLKAAANGESSASDHYAKFSEKAKEEGHMLIANMFAATSHAESLHAKKHIEELAKLGVKDYTPEIAPVEVKTTAENLTEANNGEVYEFTTMYPGFMEVAVAEKAQGAHIAFDWANRAEIKHSRFYTQALEILNTTGSDSTMNAVWVVCPKCGDTYMQSEMGAACELCATPGEQFIVFSI